MFLKELFHIHHVIVNNISAVLSNWYVDDSYLVIVENWI